MVTSLRSKFLTSRVNVARKLDAAGWGLFSIWIGIAMFAHAGRGTFLLGMGIIILAAQAVRKYAWLKIDAFWVAAGSLIAVSGVWELLNVKLELLPFVCIAAGVAFLIYMVVGGRRK
jgi:hypothetical protein